jgi:hypothetical protein
MNSDLIPALAAASNCFLSDVKNRSAFHSNAQAICKESMALKTFDSRSLIDGKTTAGVNPGTSYDFASMIVIQPGEEEGEENRYHVRGVSNKNERRLDKNVWDNEGLKKWCNKTS